ncbi:hypothetical protein T440DRAFT_24798 [Plenodomus tracheiphilus IPT5]|uniref:Uncharacterized protein n=1 Tax=Plenodomus tracheiphilus IPT5 TaxID=1408161 RepID=A0A6A7BET2_9PLEO|nr:hypothetical protein T440DRAFT_24798 [Plenodomus tracheiphilus IPT5]
MDRSQGARLRCPRRCPGPGALPTSSVISSRRWRGECCSKRLAAEAQEAARALNGGGVMREQAAWWLRPWSWGARSAVDGGLHDAGGQSRCGSAVPAKPCPQTRRTSRLASPPVPCCSRPPNARRVPGFFRVLPSKLAPSLVPVSQLVPRPSSTVRSLTLGIHPSVLSWRMRTANRILIPGLTPTR